MLSTSEYNYDRPEKKYVDRSGYGRTTKSGRSGNSNGYSFGVASSFEL